MLLIKQTECVIKSSKMSEKVWADLLSKCYFFVIFGSQIKYCLKQLTAKRVTYPLPENLQSWTTFSPGSKIGRHVSLSTTLPRLCSKCRGSKRFVAIQQGYFFSKIVLLIGEILNTAISRFF